MAGIKPNDFPLVPPTGSTELYTQTNNVNGKFTLDDVKAYLNEWTEIEINITNSTAIQNIGSSPIEILPAPGVGKYYEYEGVVEYSAVTFADYNFNSPVGIIGETSYAGNYIISSSPVFTTNKVIQLNSKSPTYVDGLSTDVLFSAAFDLNERIVLTTYNGTNATLGDGTFKIKLKYKILDFG